VFFLAVYDFVIDSVTADRYRPPSGSPVGGDRRSTWQLDGSDVDLLQRHAGWPSDSNRRTSEGSGGSNEQGRERDVISRMGLRGCGRGHIPHN